MLSALVSDSTAAPHQGGGGAAGLPPVDDTAAGYISAARIVASRARASARMAVIAFATAANLRASVTEGAAGQMIKITSGVSIACTSSMLSWSVAVTWPAARLGLALGNSLPSLHGVGVVLLGPARCCEHRPGRFTHLWIRGPPRYLRR
jgi:hypothetical protein